jgi:hypothetical protein
MATPTLSLVPDVVEDFDHRSRISPLRGGATGNTTMAEPGTVAKAEVIGISERSGTHSRSDSGTNQGTRASRPLFYDWDALMSIEPPTWLIEGYVPVNSIGMMAGAPKAMKSFLVIDWMMSVALGRSWCGLTTKQMKVIYILGEGRSALPKRLSAWCRFNKLTPEEEALRNKNLLVRFDMPQFHVASSSTNMKSDCTQINPDGEPMLIIVDTFARSFVGGDENSAKDAGMWINTAEALRGMGHTILFVHHTKKDVEFGVTYRGSSSIHGAIDCAFTLERDRKDNLLTLRNTDQKDAEEAGERTFSPVVVALPDGQNSCVLTERVKPVAEDEKKEETVADSILRIVSMKPGIRRTELREHISGRGADVLAELNTLIQDGKLTEQKAGRSKKLYAAVPDLIGF